MPNQILKKHRLSAYYEQKGCCYYCESPMWLANIEDYAARYSISKSAALRFQCTVEHLHARCDGGKDNRANIVAACRFCNGNRHKRKNSPSPIKHKNNIQGRLRAGKWLPASLQHLNMVIAGS